MRGFAILFAILVCGAALFASSGASAAHPAEIDGSTRHVSLAPSIDVLEDTTAALTYEQVLAPSVAARFRPFAGRPGPNYGLTASAIWVRFTVANRSDAPIERWLTIDHPPLDDVELFEPGRPMRASGRIHPRSQRDLARAGPSFRVALAPHESREIHLRAAGPSEIQLPVELWERDALAANDTSAAKWAGLAYGVLVSLGLYNLFLFFYVRERAHLYYGAQILFAALFLTCNDRTLIDLMPASVETVPYAISPASVAVVIGAGYLFQTRFLAVRSAYPRLFRFLRAYTFVLVGGLVAGALGLLSIRAMNRIVGPLCGCIPPIWVVVAILRWRAGFAPARYVVFAWSVFAFLVALALGAVWGWIPSRLGLMPHAAFAGEAILLSLALADAAKRRNDHIARLNAAAARFVPYEFLALLGKHELPEVKQGDQIERAMTTLFLDVRSFTTLVEKMTPQQTIAFVNAVFSEMERPIARHHGVIDKFMGDGMMVLFERADDAVRAAVGCLGALAAFNAKRDGRGEERVAIGVGVHTGRLMLGTVGGNHRLSCTVLGDSVNLASRIEGMTKVFGASILVSEATRATLADAASVPMRRLGRVAAKGKVEAVVLFEVLDGLPDSERAGKDSTRADFERGLDRVAGADLGEARACFEKCAAANPNDKAALLYVDLCAKTTKRAFAEGALRLEEK